jgi:hypothetical protein
VIASPHDKLAASGNGTGANGRGMRATDAVLLIAASKENMRPLRWFVIALVAGCLGLMAQTASAATHSVARHHRSATMLRQTSRAAANRTVPASRQGRRLPSNPANRSKTRHTTAPTGRGRGHSTYGVLPHAANATPDDRYGAFRLAAVDDPGARLNRMLESRGPPRAGPHWIPASRGFYLPLPRTSPAPYISQSNSRQHRSFRSPRQLDDSPRSGSLAKDPLLPSVFEGAAAGHDMPSTEGVPS